MKISAIILAAGKGTRMGSSEGSEIPKVMFSIGGKPMIDYSVENLKQAGIKDITAVVGYKKELVMDYLKNGVDYAFQEEQLGTGHAAMMAEKNLKGKSDAVLICYGDMPLFKTETIKKLIEIFENYPAGEKPTIAMLSVKLQDPISWAYGRIKKDKDNQILGIIEQKDCSEEELKIKESNPGFYIFDSDWLWSNFSKLKSENAQNEYYLTDMIKIAKEQGKRILAIPVSEEFEALGVNNPEQLEKAENIIKLKFA